MGILLGISFDWLFAHGHWLLNHVKITWNNRFSFPEKKWVNKQVKQWIILSQIVVRAGQCQGWEWGNHRWHVKKGPAWGHEIWAKPRLKIQRRTLQTKERDSRKECIWQVRRIDIMSTWLGHNTSCLRYFMARECEYRQLLKVCILFQGKGKRHPNYLNISKLWLSN